MLGSELSLSAPPTHLLSYLCACHSARPFQPSERWTEAQRWPRSRQEHRRCCSKAKPYTACYWGEKQQAEISLPHQLLVLLLYPCCYTLDPSHLLRSTYSISLLGKGLIRKCMTSTPGQHRTKMQSQNATSHPFSTHPTAGRWQTASCHGAGSNLQQQGESSREPSPSRELQAS